MLLAVALGACAPRAAAPVGAPVADPAALERDLVAATRPDSPRQITFAWTLDESGSRVRGRGVLRVAPPDRLRLDLFGPRNETYLAAALVGDAFRFSGGRTTLPEGVALPSPALLWAALGVVRPPGDATLEAASAADSVASLRYDTPAGQSFRYRVSTGAVPRVVQLERSGSSGVLESVRVEPGANGQVQRTRYRDWAAYRELTLEPESTKDVESFPESTWTP